VSPVPAATLLAGLAAAALLADRTRSVAVIAVGLLAVCFRVPRRRRWPYLIGTLGSAAILFVGSPLFARYGGVVYWDGPSVPVIGRIDVTSEELSESLFQSLRFAAVGLAFAAYALLLDHDRLLLAGGWLRRSVLAVALATRLLPTLERDAAGFVEALRGRGVAVKGLRGHARLLSPLVAGSLERSLNLAESMEARGFGRPGRTRAPSPPWSSRDHVALAGAALAVLTGVLWL
jgi:energy-coupling factor transport system permease protein